MASCYLPIYYETPTLLNGKLCLDGGITDNLLDIPGFVKVCPYMEEADIGNKRGTRIPKWAAVLPGGMKDMERLEGMGWEDAETWFSKSFQR